jgi:Arc/MetJ-type ribon-helix-helix transcriptional regulator
MLGHVSQKVLLLAVEDGIPDETEALDLEDEIEAHDAGDEPGGDEGQDEVQGDGPQREEVVEENRPGRRSASEVIRELRRERQEVAAQLAELKAQQAQAQQHRNQPDPYQAQREAQLEQERLALMDPSQQLAYYRQQDQARMQAEFQRLRFEMADSQDQARFDTLKATNPLAAKYAGEVDRIIAFERQNGRNVSRETALRFAIGQAVLAKAGTTTTRQRKQAAERVASQQTKPTNPGGMSREGRASGDDIGALERRLRGVEI